MKKVVFVLLYAIHSVCFCSQIVREINSLAEVIPYVDENTLVLFDIDNTLLHPQTDLGSDQWLCHKIQELNHHGKDHQQALQEMLPIYFHINRHINLVPTEPHAAQIVKDIQRKTNLVMCLTARSQPIIDVTQQQLAHNNFHFDFVTSESFAFELDHPCYFVGGVLYCASNDKGIALFHLLDALHVLPDRIVIVDDKERNINALVNAARKRNIACIGLRYAGCDHRVARFNKDHTQQELEQFIMRKPCTYISAEQ